RLSVSEDIEREVLKLPHFQREIDARVQVEVQQVVQVALRAQSDVLDEMASKVQAKQKEYDELWGQVAELEAMRRAESEELDAKREEIARQSEALHANQQAMMAQFEA